MLHQVTSGYVRLSHFTLEGRDVELDNIKFGIKKWCFHDILWHCHLVSVDDSGHVIFYTCPTAQLHHNNIDGEDEISSSEKFYMMIRTKTKQLFSIVNEAKFSASIYYSNSFELM